MWLRDKSSLFNPEVVVNLLEEKPVAICLVKRMKPCALLLTGLQLALPPNHLCSVAHWSASLWLLLWEVKLRYLMQVVRL